MELIGIPGANESEGKESEAWLPLGGGGHLSADAPHVIDVSGGRLTFF